MTMQENIVKNYDGLALFSGGLDSILAVKLLEEQNLRIKCLHFISPFFGSFEKLAYWRKVYGLDIMPVDISEDFAAMLRQGPAHGTGSVLNPCVDCKILMMRRASALLEDFGAKFLCSGEVLGQRPMSQRRDTLNIIRRDAGVKDTLLRPLCARLLDPTEAELSGFVDREKLMDIAGRGRGRQLELAARLGVKVIPTPAGGCLLTERENARSFWPVLRHSRARAEDFRLARTGRQCWSFDDSGNRAWWLCIGRNNADNESLHKLASEEDITFKIKDFPGPIALARQFAPWPEHVLADAAAYVASFSGKAVKAAESAASGATVLVRAHKGAKGLDGPGRILEVIPSRKTPASWSEFTWAQAKEEIRAFQHSNCLC